MLIKSKSGKKFKFFYHYNKPLSTKLKKPMLSLHALGKCSFVEELFIEVYTQSKRNKKQPWITITGSAKEIYISNLAEPTFAHIK